MPHRVAHNCSSGLRKYDSGWPATFVDANNPHNKVLPVRGVVQIKYESMIQPESVADDVGRETQALVRIHDWIDEYHTLACHCRLNARLRYGMLQ